MEAYKFETMIQKDGIIQIPEIAKLENEKVEVFVVISPISMMGNYSATICGCLS